MFGPHRQMRRGILQLRRIISGRSSISRPFVASMVDLSLRLCHRRWDAPYAQSKQKLLLSRFMSTALVRLKWTPDRIPNPKLDPKAAGRPNVQASNICDPDQLLHETSKDILEGYIKGIPSEVAVVIVNAMDPEYLAQSGSKDEAAKLFAMTLHNQWGVGDKAKNDGILVFLAIEDRVVFISVGSGMSNQLTEIRIDEIINGMKDGLRRKCYDVAVEHAVLHIDDILKSNDAGRSSDERFGGKAGKRNLKIFLLGFLAMIVYDIISKEKKRKKDEKKYIPYYDVLPVVYDSDEISCPHCLERYDWKETEKVRLQCGHSFCRSCYTSLTAGANQDRGTCVICAEPLKLLDPPKPMEGVQNVPVPEVPAVGNDRDEERVSRDAEYRAQRFYQRYRYTVTDNDLKEIIAAIRSGYEEGKKKIESWRLDRKELEDAATQERIKQYMADDAAREKARSKGSSGSSSGSFGGGSSSGGGGGSW